MRQRPPSIASLATSSVWPNDGDMDRALRAMLTISEALLVAREFNSGLSTVLEALGAACGARRSTVSLLDPLTGDVTVAASVRAADVDDVVKEDMAADVARTGRPVVVARTSDDSRFLQVALLNTVVDCEELSYICLPIVLDQQPIGSLRVETIYHTDAEHERTVRFLRVVSSIVAHAIKVHQAAEAERRLVPETGRHAGERSLERRCAANIIGASRPMLDVYEQIGQVAPGNTTVLLRGESGTGKELIAQAIHDSSSRAGKPFIKVNCAALPHDLIESELFGYEPGAFTGATQAKRGRFELADGGTLFLDEIGELTRATQAKLLRVLQTREFERLGGTQTIRASVRLLTATNKDLEEAIHAGEFREDLYYRLNVFAINVPALRERRSDIAPLAHHFLQTFSRRLGKRVTRIAAPAVRLLMSYSWPGNVRELENTIERGIVVCDSPVLHISHLPPALRAARLSPLTDQLSLRQATEAFEKEIVQEALQRASGSRSTAARLLKTTRRVLDYKVRRYNIDWQRFKN